ncbi:membrane protein YoeI [Salmonella enterica subsp. enterica]|nr:membrane protein YoeI [Salmonella enterica subsp. enterica]
MGQFFAYATAFAARENDHVHNITQTPLAWVRKTALR